MVEVHEYEEDIALTKIVTRDGELSETNLKDLLQRLVRVLKSDMKDLEDRINELEGRK